MSGLARKGDPQTSHDAADSLDASRLEKIVVAAHEKFGAHGAICDDIVTETGMAWNTVSARLKPLIDKGFLKVLLDDHGKPVTRPGHTGKAQQVRVVTDKAPETIKGFWDD